MLRTHWGVYRPDTRTMVTKYGETWWSFDRAEAETKAGTCGGVVLDVNVAKRNWTALIRLGDDRVAVLALLKELGHG